jgi:hypothetical protein
MNIRWKRWGVGVAGVSAVYAATGFWLVPQLIKSQLPKYAQTELERQASIGEVSFNPFTLRLEAKEFKLAEANGMPLFSIGGLAVEMDWRSAVRRAWSLAEVRVTAPVVSLAIAPDGTFNIAQLLDTLNKKPHEESTGMPRLVIRRFALEQGKIEMRDLRVGYSETFTPIDFALNNLSTLPDENGDYALSADGVHGGKLHWKGTAALNPIGASGLLTLDKVELPGVGLYLKSVVNLRIDKGQLSAKLPYKLSYQDGKFDFNLAGAGLALRNLALREPSAREPFAKLNLFEVGDVGVDLARHGVSVGVLRVDDGALAVRRDAKGVLDWSRLALAAAPAGAAAPAAKPAAPASDWKLQFKQVALERVALSAVDETVSPAFKASVGSAALHMKLDADLAAAGTKLTVADADFSLADVAMSSGAQTPFKLAKIGFTEGTLDLAARRASLGRLYADGGQLELLRDAKGRFAVLDKLPTFGDRQPQAAAASAAKPTTAAAAPWAASVKTIEFSKFGARYDDAGTGIKSTLQDVGLKLSGASSDLKQPVKFDAGLSLKEGGKLSAQGKVVPASGALDMDLLVNQLALAPVQPLLAKSVKLKIAGGSINAKGHLSTGAGDAKNPALRYQGSFEVAKLALNEEDGDPFAAWKSVRADQLHLNVTPNKLDVQELRVVEPNAKLIIENDRSFNAARLLVEQPAPAAKATPAMQATAATAVAASDAKTKPQPADAAFPVRVRRVRFQNAKLDFTDLSLRPQFSAKIFELNGVITGLSTRRDARSQVELDGRVDEFGLARVRGQLNPFVPADNTDMSVIFKNVDMVSASPYSMKFAGYKIAEGKISLDLQYKVRDNQLEGNNHIVLDNMTLGERIDSPDALHLPLELALAILKDSDGRIDLGLPVAGDMKDPQFSYGAVVWKAVGNVLTKVVTSPFRALGNLFGVSGDKLETIDFDAGSNVLLPPEREKLGQIAKILAKKGQLKLAVPAQYSEQADGQAMRVAALRRTVATRAGIKLDGGEQPGPLDIGERKVRGALRDLYAERLGKADLEQRKQAAEAAEAAANAKPAASAGGEAVKQQKLALWQRLGKMVQGEPQVADATGFYRGLQDKLEQNQPLPAEALPQLGQQRAAAILAALKEAGVDTASMHAGGAEKISVEAGQPVAVKLGLSAK